MAPWPTYATQTGNRSLDETDGIILARTIDAIACHERSRNVRLEDQIPTDRAYTAPHRIPSAVSSTQACPSPCADQSAENDPRASSPTVAESRETATDNPKQFGQLNDSFRRADIARYRPRYTATTEALSCPSSRLIVWRAFASCMRCSGVSDFTDGPPAAGAFQPVKVS